MGPGPHELTKAEEAAPRALLHLLNCGRRDGRALGSTTAEVARARIMRTDETVITKRQETATRGLLCLLWWSKTMAAYLGSKRRMLKAEVARRSFEFQRQDRWRKGSSHTPFAVGPCCIGDPKSGEERVAKSQQLRKRNEVTEKWRITVDGQHICTFRSIPFEPADLYMSHDAVIVFTVMPICLYATEPS